MDELIPIIEHIATLSDKTEGDKWNLAEAIHDAFIEFPAYTEGLLSGLMERTKYSNAQIYNLRNAWEVKRNNVYLWNSLNLPVTHYYRMYNLQEKYNLSASEVADYLNLSDSENWSVSKMAQEVQRNHEPDPEKEFEKHFEVMLRKMRYVQNDPLFSSKVPPITRAVYYDLVKELENL